MRAVVQRVSEARVEVEGECVGAMREGLLALVGVAREDTPEQADALARKLVGLRVFEGPGGGMDRSLLDVGGTLGVVSQCTLLGETRKGRRPSFSNAADPEEARPLIYRVIESARSLGAEVICGQFGARMEVSLVNQGPFTLWVDTEAR